MENIEGWGIERRIWWGHRITANLLPEGGLVEADTT